MGSIQNIYQVLETIPCQKELWSVNIILEVVFEGLACSNIIVSLST